MSNMNKHNLKLKLTEYMFTIKKLDSQFLIAKTMLDRINEFPDFNIEEIAFLANVTPSSVTKFCKKIGYNGFSTLNDDSQSYLYNLDIANQMLNINHSNSAYQFYDSFINQYLYLSNKVFNYLDHNIIKSLAIKLSKSKKITVFSGLHGFAASNLFAELLNNDDLTIYEINREADEAIISNIFDSNDMIFIISLTGERAKKIISKIDKTSPDQLSKIIVLSCCNISFPESITHINFSNLSNELYSNMYTSLMLQNFFILLVGYLREIQSKN